MEVFFSCKNIRVTSKQKNKMDYNFSFDTAFNQFYIVDKGVMPNTGSDTFWSEEAFTDRVAIEEGVLGISTSSYGPVKGKLYLLDSLEADIDFNKFDHVVEASIQISSGVMQLVDCPNFSVEMELNLLPGSYRVRVYSLNLEMIEDDEGNDFYIIEVWQEDEKSKRVLKRWSQTN